MNPLHKLICDLFRGALHHFLQQLSKRKSDSLKSGNSADQGTEPALQIHRATNAYLTTYVRVCFGTPINLYRIHWDVCMETTSNSMGSVTSRKLRLFSPMTFPLYRSQINCPSTFTSYLVDLIFWKIVCLDIYILYVFIFAFYAYILTSKQLIRIQ